MSSSSHRNYLCKGQGYLFVVKYPQSSKIIPFSVVINHYIEMCVTNIELQSTVTVAAKLSEILAGDIIMNLYKLCYTAFPFNIKNK